jgi:dephospho-CoA kinase
MSATSRIKSKSVDPPPPWKHGRTPVIGLIGAIGGGKSRVAALLAARGAMVIDADSTGHRLLEEPSIRDRVIARFGPDIACHSGGPADNEYRGRRINRQALAAIVFSDPTALRALEAVLHPLMRQEFLRIITRAASVDRPAAVVLDAAVLLEAGWQNLCDRVIFVDAPRRLRLERLREQRGWTAETLSAREQAQWPLDQKKRCADLVIANDADLETLERNVDRIWSNFLQTGSIDRADAKAGLIGLA